MERESFADFYRGAGDQGDRAPKARAWPVRLLLNAAHLYRLRVREQPLQEVLALLGIAAGVALLFAVQVATTSIGGSVRQLTHGITGKASLEVAARGPQGMDERMVNKAARLASVEAAAPALQQRINVVGPAGTRSLTLVGVDDRLTRIGGKLVRRLRSKQGDLGTLGLFLTAETADTVGAGRGQPITIESGDQKREIPIAGTLTADDIGGFAKSPVALAPLSMAQRLTGMPDRISRVLVQPRNGARIEATNDLRGLVGDRLDVRASDSEADLLAEALKPDQQSSALFSAIAVVIGLLFAYNAMLLAMARRRRLVAYLRMIGADRATVIATLAFEALVLGAAASLVGLVIGDLLSRVAFQSIPEYLTSGFSIGEQRVVEAKTIALSVAGGLGAALLASAKPALDLYRVDPAEAAYERVPIPDPKGAIWGLRALLIGLTVIAVASSAVAVAPALTPLGIGALIVGLVLVLGPSLAYALSAANRVTRIRGGIGLALAVDELATTPVRSTALAVIAAVAVTGVLSIGGARQDLERGVDQVDRDLYGSGDLWIRIGGDDNIFLTKPFHPGTTLKDIGTNTAVRGVDHYRGSFLDFGEQRLRVVTRLADDPLPVAPSQLVDGKIELASRRIRAGGWVALSDAVARERKLHLKDRVIVPTPSGERPFRLAATTTNYSWPSGAIVMNSDDYRKAWDSKAVSALTVRLAPGIPPSVGKRIVENALGPESALRVQTADELRKEHGELVVQGLARLRQISTLVLGASVLAIVAAMFAGVWQRRTRLASLRAMGMYRSELYRTLFAETSLIVFLGCVAGLVFGLYCQILASRWTEIATGFQTPFSPALGLGLATVIQVMALTLVATAGPAYLASRIAPRAAEEA